METFGYDGSGPPWSVGGTSRNANAFFFFAADLEVQQQLRVALVHCYKTTSISVVISTKGKLSMSCCALTADLSISNSAKTTWNVWIGTVLGAGTRAGAQVGPASFRGKVGLWTARSRIARDNGLDRLFLGRQARFKVRTRLSKEFFEED
jgi:hypothetical protein